MNGELIVSQQGDVFHLTLNRPSRGNSLSETLVDALTRQLDLIAASGGRAMVLRGAGRNFCTGFDLSDLEQSSDGDLLLRFVRIEQLLARIWAAPFETIAVASGHAVGAGADLFVACRRRIAVHDATFSFPGTGFGLVLGSRRLGVRIGEERARQLVLSRSRVDAQAALTMNLASDLVAEADTEAFLAKALELGAQSDQAMLPLLGDAVRQNPGELDRDLAYLVRSAARAGLRDRIRAFRDQR